MSADHRPRRRYAALELYERFVTAACDRYRRTSRWTIITLVEDDYITREAPVALQNMRARYWRDDLLDWGFRDGPCRRSILPPPTCECMRAMFNQLSMFISIGRTGSSAVKVRERGKPFSALFDEGGRRILPHRVRSSQYY